MEGGTAPRWGIRYPRFDFSCQGNQACVPGTHGSARQVCVVTGKPGGRTEMLPWWVPLVSLTNRLSTGATGFKAAGPTESAKCPCSLQLFAWLISHQPAATSQQYSSLRTNQHQSSANSQPNGPAWLRAALAGTLRRPEAMVN
jgi:hypothetical protein